MAKHDLGTLTTATRSASYKATGMRNDGNPYKLTMVASGTIGSTTLIDVQVSPDEGVTWVTLEDVSLTALGAITFDVVGSNSLHPMYVSVDLTGTPTSLNIVIFDGR